MTSLTTRLVSGVVAHWMQKLTEGGTNNESRKKKIKAKQPTKAEQLDAWSIRSNCIRTSPILAHLQVLSELFRGTVSGLASHFAIALFTG